MKIQPIPHRYLTDQELRDIFPDKVFEWGRLLIVEPGEFITRQGYPVDNMFCLLEGIVKGYSTSVDGKNMIYAFFKRGEILGDIEFFTGCETLGTIQAVTTAKCFILDVRKYRERLMNDMEFLRTSIKKMGEKLARASHNNAINLLQPVHVRVAAYILTVACGGLFQTSVTDMAELIGASYRHVWRVLQDFCAAKLLKKDGHTYIITDAEALRQLGSEIYTQ
jgi:CRP-like cAMP-binding protein